MTTETKTNGIRVSENQLELDSAIQALYPHLTADQINTVKQAVMKYVASGLREGWNVALAKETSQGVNLRLLTMAEVAVE